VLHEPSPLKETLSLCISHFVRSVEEGSVDAVSQQTSQPVIGSRRQHRSDRGRVPGAAPGGSGHVLGGHLGSDLAHRHPVQVQSLDPFLHRDGQSGPVAVPCS